MISINIQLFCLKIVPQGRGNKLYKTTLSVIKEGSEENRLTAISAKIFGFSEYFSEYLCEYSA